MLSIPQVTLAAQGCGSVDGFGRLHSAWQPREGRVRWSPLPSTFWGQSLGVGLEVPRPRPRAMQQGRGRKGQSCRAQAKEGMSGGGSPQEGGPGESCLGKGAVAPQQQAAVPCRSRAPCCQEAFPERLGLWCGNMLFAEKQKPTSKTKKL